MFGHTLFNSVENRGNRKNDWERNDDGIPEGGVEFRKGGDGGKS